MSSKKQVQLLNDEVQDIISYRPGWVIRSGNFIFLLVLLVLLALTFFLRYPDVIKASVRIAPLSFPKILTAPADGHLEKLFVTNGQQVEKGQRLAYIKSAGMHEQVLQLQKWIMATEPAIDAGDMKILLFNPPPLLYKLGELQQNYEHFQDNIQHRGKAIANSYYKKDHKQKFLQELLKLRNKTEEWLQMYIVISPEEGKLEFASFMQENQLLNNGQKMFFVQPPSGYYAELKVGQNNSAQIKNGQKVIMRLYSYPSEEFGYIEGRVTYISNMPIAKDSFLIKVELQKRQQANYKKDILIKNDLLGSAEIITGEKRLIDKFFKQLIKILSR